MSNQALTKEQALHELWKRGSLRWKLKGSQKDLYDLYYSGKYKTMTWLLARRSGKTFALSVLAIEQCLRTPNSIVKFLSPTKTQVDTNVRPIFKKILNDCPDDLKPNYVARQYIYYFKNGSEIQLAGTDNGHAEKLRGGDSHIWMVDEAGSCDNLKDIMQSILIPTTLTTKGKGILASTPPKDPEHDFVSLIEKADAEGSLIKKTVFENSMVTLEDIKELTEELGGEESDAYQREMMCKIIKDSTTFVIPEFTEAIQPEVVREWPKPPFYDAYVGMDLGFNDLTVLIFGYYDFRADKIIIEDEIIADFQKKDMNLQVLTKLILNKEEELYTNIYTNEIKAPYMRVSDIDYIVTGEITNISKNLIKFSPTKKDDNDAAINNLRLLISKKKIIINPKCKILIQHLKNVKWAKGKKTFARSQDNGHYDAVDALKYLVRAVVTGKNPYPAHYDFNMRDLYVNDRQKFNNPGNNRPVMNKTNEFPGMEMYRKLFGGNQRRGK